jgi:twinkle protein
MDRAETKELEKYGSVITPAAVLDSMLYQFRNGKEKGTKTYVRDIDTVNQGNYTHKAWSWKPSEVTIFSGYNGEGKTLILIYLCILKALNEGKKFAFFSPENFPPDDFFDDMIHTILGKTTDKENKLFNMSEAEYLGAFNRIKDNFYFVYPRDAKGNPDFTIDRIEQEFETLIETQEIYGVIVDPYIKIRHEMQGGEQEHLYASRFMMDRSSYARKNNICYFLVMHQTTPHKEKDGNYPKPTLYSIKGGGTFADSADNVITIWRPFRGTEPNHTEVRFISEKIKKQKLVGFPSTVIIDFDRLKNRYIGKDGYDYLDGSIPAPEGFTTEKIPVYRTDKFVIDGESDFLNTNTPLPF